MFFTGAPLKTISYRTIHRLTGSDWGFTLGKPTLLKYKGPIAKLNHDFIQISTEFANGMIQTDFHAQVIPKPAVLQRKARQRAGLPLNIIILGLDQTSRATFQRLLADSYKFLRDELQAFMFKGFSLVGEATTPQLTALLTGRTVEENCELHEARTGFVGARTVDEWPFIFKTLKEHGYATLFSEDAPPIGKANFFLSLVWSCHYCARVRGRVVGEALLVNFLFTNLTNYLDKRHNIAHNVHP